MTDVKTAPSQAPTYDGDFYAWTKDQADRLRAARPNSIDWENVAEEIETLGRSEKREIESRLNVLLVHLAKWGLQSERRKSGWRATIVEQRRQLIRAIEENPSLRHYPAAILTEEYETARLKAADETDLPEDLFPIRCPFTIGQVLDPDYWPDASPT